MKRLTIISLVLLIVGCAGTSQNGAAGLAYSSYLDGDYQNALKQIAEAEQGHKITADLKAELTYLKAQSYEGLGQQNKADGLYEYLKEEHSHSQYGYLAKKMLESNN